MEHRTKIGRLKLLLFCFSGGKVFSTVCFSLLVCSSPAQSTPQSFLQSSSLHSSLLLRTHIHAFHWLYRILLFKVPKEMDWCQLTPQTKCICMEMIFTIDIQLLHKSHSLENVLTKVISAVGFTSALLLATSLAFGKHSRNLLQADKQNLRP